MSRPHTQVRQLLPILLLAVAIPACGDSSTENQSAATSGTIPTTSLVPSTVSANRSAEDCLDAARSASAPPALSVADPIHLAASNGLVDLPVPGLAPRVIVETTHLVSAEDYVAIAAFADPTKRLAALQDAGFRGGIRVRFESGPDIYSAILLRLASPDAALRYFHEHTEDVCELATAASELPASAGIAFMRIDDLARAVFVVGDTEVNLNVCTCVEVADRVRVATEWADAVSTQLATS